MDITFEQIWKSVKSHRYFILASALIFAAIVFFISFFFIPPKHISTAKIYVEGTKRYYQNSEERNISYARKSMYNFIEALDSETFYELIISATGLSYSPQELKQMVYYMPNEKSVTFNVHVTSNDAHTSQLIAQSIIDYSDFAIEPLNVSAKLTLIEKPTLSTKPASPNIPRDTLFGLFSGFALGFIFAVIDDLIKSKKTLK